MIRTAARDRIFKGLLLAAAAAIILICGGMFYSLISGATPAFDHFGFFRFIASSDWNPDRPATGRCVHRGAVLTSLLAMLFCLPLSLPVALFTGEYFGAGGSRNNRYGDRPAGRHPVDRLRAVGFYVIRPVIVDLGLSSQGFGILTASVVLAIMVIPYAASLSSEFISMVSRELKEGAYSLGGTRLDVIRRVVFPVAGSGIFASYVLALGRALGETMAVTMLIGNTNLIPTGLTATGNTMASVIANQFGEADGLKLSSLVAIGLLLFIITAVINLIGRLILRKFR
ncbi:MAG: PstC family ABC transporter permease [Alistipes sp.]